MEKDGSGWKGVKWILWIGRKYRIEKNEFEGSKIKKFKVEGVKWRKLGRKKVWVEESMDGLEGSRMKIGERRTKKVGLELGVG